MLSDRIFTTGFSRRIGLFLAMLLALSLIVGVVFFFGSSPVWYGYVVGEDRKIYMVNLDSGEVEWVSRAFDQIGRPNSLEINRRDSILYVGSDRIGFRPLDYVPLLAVRLNETADIVFESYVEPFEDLRISTFGMRSSRAVVDLCLNPAAEVLYVGYIGHRELRTIVDPLTGEAIGRLDIPVLKQYEISPDGTEAAVIYPSGSRVSSNGDVREWPGGVTTRSLVTGETVMPLMELEDNQGLNPPWAQLRDNLVYVGNHRSIGVYDRESGEQLAKYDFIDENFRTGYSVQNYATQIPGRDDVVMSFGNYVTVFDPITAEVKSRTYIGDGDMLITEVVVTDKPLIPAD